MDKNCSKCLIDKDTSLFSKQERTRDKLFVWCKQCVSEYSKGRRVKKIRGPRPKLDAVTLAQRTKIVQKKYRDKITKSGLLAERERNRRKNNINYRIAHRLRIRMLQALKGIDKSAKTTDLLGISISEFKIYFQSLFTKGMSWDNYDQWHIDHIKACSKFDLTDPKQQRECFHYKNLQPLWEADNLKKSNK